MHRVVAASQARNKQASREKMKKYHNMIKVNNHNYCQAKIKYVFNKIVSTKYFARDKYVCMEEFSEEENRTELLVQLYSTTLIIINFVVLWSWVACENSSAKFKHF